MSVSTTRAQRRQLERENAKQPLTLTEVPRSEWPAAPGGAPPRYVWRSRGFLAMLFDAPHPAVARLSILRTSIGDGGWVAGITWDEMQRLKAEAGFGHGWAVEVFPDDREVVNVANIRHLWILPGAPDFAWRTPEADR